MKPCDECGAELQVLQGTQVIVLVPVLYTNDDGEHRRGFSCTKRLCDACVEKNPSVAASVAAIHKDPKVRNG